MRMFTGPEPAHYHTTHKLITPNTPFAARLELAGAPMERYVYPGGPAGFWVERWIVDLCMEWSYFQHEDWNYELLKRVISYSYRTNDADFAQACMTALRLQGTDAVQSMLNERKDLVR